MRIRGAQSPPPYLNRREQYRMLGLIAVLGMTVFAIRVTARPGFWAWMFPAEQTVQTSSSDTADPRDVDHSVLFDKPLSPDEFYALDPRTGAGQAGSANDKADSAPSKPDSSKLDNDRPAADEQREADREFVPIDTEDPTVNPVLLEGIVDRRVGLRSSEADAYFGMLAKVAALPDEVVESAAIKEVNYSVLMREPDYYRGRLVTLRGVIKRLVGISAAENRYGVEMLYDVWLFTKDSGNNPIHIRCTEIPPDVPQGLSIKKPVEVRITGYFFRIEGYPSNGGLHTAPLVLAKGVDWQPVPELTRSQKAAVPYVGTFVAIVSFAVVFVLWRYRQSDRAFAESHLHELTLPGDESISDLQDIPTTSVADYIKSLHDDQEPA